MERQRERSSAQQVDGLTDEDAATTRISLHQQGRHHHQLRASTPAQLWPKDQLTIDTKRFELPVCDHVSLLLRFLFAFGFVLARVSTTLYP